MTLDEMRAKVQSMLVELLGHVELSQDGTFSVAHESTRIFVRAATFGQGTAVSIYALTNIDVPASPELYRYVAEKADAYVLGHLGARENDGKVTLVFRHTTLGEQLDKEELRIGLVAVATTANELDDEIKARFGGRTFNEQAVQPGEPSAAQVAAPEAVAHSVEATTATKEEAEETGGYL
jgi:hypothetical protein